MNGMPGSKLPEDLLAVLVEHANEGLVVVDGSQAELPVVWMNPAFERMTGFERAELIGHNLRVLQAGDRQQPDLAPLRAAMAAEQPCSVVLRNYRPGGALFWNSLRIHPWRDAQGTLWWLGFARDVSEEREMELVLGRRTDNPDEGPPGPGDADSVDRLTGLQTQRSFELALELAWFSSARARTSLALFLFAPDYFDIYLDTFGRVAGDSCLRMFARGVAAAFRRSSDITGRVGETELAALAIGMAQDMLGPHARRVSERVNALAIRNPRAPLSRHVTASAVVVLAQPGESVGWRELLAEARQSLARAQASGCEQLVVQDYGPTAPGS
jgi:diguanylate cyclase (GGDEF)-like protein/PAS domain S-box-containing protein